MSTAESFFQYECKLSDREEPSKTSSSSSLPAPLSWDDFNARLALVSERDSNRILLFDEEGQKIKDQNVSRTTDTYPTKLKWQPVKDRHPLLAIGWSDGVVSIYHSRDRIQREDEAHLHQSHSITMLEWNVTSSSDKSRLVTGGMSDSHSLTHSLTQLIHFTHPSSPHRLTRYCWCLAC
jgi:hypothetical protein